MLDFEAQSDRPRNRMARMVLMQAVICAFAFSFKPLPATALETHKADNVTGRPVKIDNKTPFDWVAVDYKTTINDTNSWLPIAFHGTEVIGQNDSLEVIMPGSACFYELRITVNNGGEPLFGEYTVDVCNDPNPQLK